MIGKDCQIGKNFREDMTALNLKNLKLENIALKDFNDSDDTSDDCFETQ